MIETTIICPCLNEGKYIEKCLQSILHQDYPLETMEILFVDGGSNDNTISVIQHYQERYTNIKIFDNPKHTAPCAMNIGIRAALGKYIIRMDAHTYYPSNYISCLIKYLEVLLGAQNVGGCCKTLPANDSKIAHAIAIATSHPLGIGNSTFRTGTTDIQEVDTVPFGCWRKEWIQKIGPFDEELTRNQDDEYNARTIKNGGKIYILPQLQIDYFARDTLKKTYIMFYQYGQYKPLVNKKIGHPATIRQFVPVFFVVGLFLGLIGACLWWPFTWAYITALCIYLLATTIVAIKYKNILLPIVFFTIHFSYGWGYITGLYKIIFHRSFSTTVNH